MSIPKKVLLGTCGAAALAIGAVSTAEAHSVAGVASTATSCDLYARQYAATNAPLLIGWRSAYNFAYNQCLAGGPAFVARAPVASAIAGAVTAPVAAGAALAAGAVQTAGTIAGTALAAPAIAAQALAAPVVAGTAALAPPATTTAQVSDAEPVVQTNYVGSFEAEDAEKAAETTGTSVAALQAPQPDIEADMALAVAPAQGTPEWMSYCAAKYRSFDPASGTYLAYSGVRRMCR